MLAAKPRWPDPVELINDLCQLTKDTFFIRQIDVFYCIYFCCIEIQSDLSITPIQTFISQSNSFTENCCGKCFHRLSKQTHQAIYKFCI